MTKLPKGPQVMDLDDLSTKDSDIKLNINWNYLGALMLLFRKVIWHETFECLQ